MFWENDVASGVVNAQDKANFARTVVDRFEITGDVVGEGKRSWWMLSESIRMGSLGFPSTRQRVEVVNALPFAKSYESQVSRQIFAIT